MTVAGDIAQVPVKMSAEPLKRPKQKIKIKKGSRSVKEIYHDSIGFIAEHKDENESN